MISDINPEHTLLSESIRRFVEREYSMEQRRAVLNGGPSLGRMNWVKFAELGWLGAGLPEEVGGLGGHPQDSFIILEALGEALVVEPILACATLAARLILESADEPATHLAPLISGEAIYVFAHGEAAGRGRPDHVGATARLDGECYELSGRKAVVIGAPYADQLIISARTSDPNADVDGVSLFMVGRERLTNRLTTYQLIDGQAAADLDLTGLRIPPSGLLGREGGASLKIVSALDHATIGACAEALGAMDRTLWLTRDFLNMREQFGVVLGTFQVLQHAMAEMLIEVEQSRSMLLRGIAALEASAPIRAKAVSASKAFISRSAEKVAKLAMQLHGAIGLTDEYVISHYFKRLICFAQSYGSADVHYNRFRTIPEEREWIGS